MKNLIRRIGLSKWIKNQVLVRLQFKTGEKIDILVDKKEVLK